MNSTSDRVDLPRGERVLAAVADAITDLYNESLAIQTRIDTDLILKTVTATIAKRLPVTCTAILLKPDPETSRVVFADATNPGLADYLDSYVASLLRPGEAPTYGLARKVIETGGPLLMPSITMAQLQGMVAEQARHYTESVPMPLTVDRLSVLMVPMRSGPAIIGTLGLFDWQASGILGEHDLEWMQRAADRVGLSVENAQLRNKAMDRVERMAALSEIALAISSGQDLRVTLNVVLERAVATLEVDASDILVVDEDKGGVTIASSIGFRSGLSPEVHGPMPSEAARQWLVEHRIAAPTAIDWISQSRRWMLAREGFRSYSAAPLTVRDTFVGVLEVFKRSEMEPDEEWLGFLDAMGTQAAIAIDHFNLLAARRKGGQRAQSRRFPAPALSERELQILRMVVDGASNRDVAERLHLSQNTIKFHVRQLLEKGEVANRTELATKAVQEGWV